MKARLEGKRLLIATHNRGKVEEISVLLRPLFSSLGMRWTSSAEQGLVEPSETEATFVGNARIKAHTASKATGLPALADDSGISVDALDGAPGVYTANWADTPKGRDFPAAMARVWTALDAMNAAFPRRAQFNCTLALAWPDGRDAVFTGVMAGHLVWPMRGENGHGYDPMFVPDGHDLTLGEMDRWEKNAISHRACAVQAMLDDVSGMVGNA